MQTAQAQADALLYTEGAVGHTRPTSSPSATLAATPGQNDLPAAPETSWRLSVPVMVVGLVVFSALFGGLITWLTDKKEQG